MDLLNSNIEEIVERSIYDALRKNIVAAGYLPDIMNTTRYPIDPENPENLNQVGIANWTADINTIKTNMGFCCDLLGTSAAKAKGDKKVPRIAIVAKRIMPGDLGYPPQEFYVKRNTVPITYTKSTYPKESANMHFDIHIVSETQQQLRFMNFIIQQTLGQKVYIYLYNDPTQNFFIKQYNYYETPDAKDGYEENIYQYEVQDLYLVNLSTITIAPITEIDVNLQIATKTGEKILPNGQPNGPIDNGGQITITP